MNLSITPEQEKNLRTLAAYLLSGELKAKFDMETFSEDEKSKPAFSLNSSNSMSLKSGAHYCGSVGCSIGHGPYAGIPKMGLEMWHEYANRAFGVCAWSYVLDILWRNCFDSGWTHIDNTPQGAGQRILNILENNEQFQNWLTKPE